MSWRDYSLFPAVRFGLMAQWYVEMRKRGRTAWRRHPQLGGALDLVDCATSLRQAGLGERQSCVSSETRFAFCLSPQRAKLQGSAKS